MLKRITDLEEVSIQLETNPDERQVMTDAAKGFVEDFLTNIRIRKTYESKDSTGDKLLEFQIEEDGKSIESLIEVFKTEVSQVALNAASGGHLGYIPGGGVYPTAIGDYLAAVSNEYAGIFFASPGAVRMENMLLRWLCDLMKYPKTALGNLTSGGSIANLIAVATARDFKQIKSRDIDQSVIYLTQQVHHSVQKAIRIAGLAESKLAYIPTDSKFRMDTKALRNQILADKAEGLKPFLIIGSIGTTDTGAVDPINGIADVAEEFDLWFHIDAAYGGFFVMTEEGQDHFKGVERSDSLTIDPHKGLFLSYGTGAVLIKNIEALQSTHYYVAGYMQDAVLESSEPNPADLSPELTKHFRGLRMWLPLQLNGLKRFKAALSEKIWLARYFHQEIQKLGFEVGPEPELSVVIYRYTKSMEESNQFNKELVDHVHKDGRVFISSTTLAGEIWLRLAVLSFRTHLKEINLLLEVIKEFLTKNKKRV